MGFAGGDGVFQTHSARYPAVRLFWIGYEPSAIPVET